LDRYVVLAEENIDGMWFLHAMTKRSQSQKAEKISSPPLGQIAERSALPGAEPASTTITDVPRGHI
jgi:hypothetical protein